MHLCMYTGYSVRLKARLPVVPESKIRAEKSMLLSPHDMVTPPTHVYSYIHTYIHTCIYMHTNLPQDRR